MASNVEQSELIPSSKYSNSNVVFDDNGGRGARIGDVRHRERSNKSMEKHLSLSRVWLGINHLSSLIVLPERFFMHHP